MTSSLTQQWLRQVIGPYSDKDRVYTDVDAALGSYPTLRPKTDVYTFDDGRQQLLLCVHGLIPITFRTSTYNIPVAFWMSLNYPKDAPIAYVVPTSEMLVKASKNVDPSGKCQTAYLEAWERKSEAPRIVRRLYPASDDFIFQGCNLKGFIESLQDIFSQDPPVYAKPKRPSAAPLMNPPPRPPPVTPNLPPGLPPVPPVPNGWQSPLAAPSLTPDGRPMPPPKPGGSSIFSPAAAVVDPLASSSALATRPPPSLPPNSAPQTPQRQVDRPPPPPWAQAFQQPTNVPSPQSSLPPTHRTSSSISGYSPQYTGPYSAASPERPPPPPPPSQQWSAVSSPSSRGSALSPAVTGQSYQPQPQYAYGPSPPTVQQAPPPPQVHTQPLQTAAPVPKAPAPNLLDADDEPSNPTEVDQQTSSFVPPRSMNPELQRLHDTIYQKIVGELQTFSNTVNEDQARLRGTQADLLQGEPAIRDEMARLVAVRDVCNSVAERLRGTVQTAESNVQELKRKGDPEVDELVCSTAIVYNQLINLVAEDNAIEDTIYHLHRALNSGRMDLDRFIRTTRVLAEEQFMKRALIQKITSGIPMGAAMNWP